MMTTKLNPVVEAVTARIEERSRDFPRGLS